MAAAAVEVAAEAAEVAAPEAEAIGSRAEVAGRETMDRLMDVGTGVLIGQTLSDSKSSPANATASPPDANSPPAGANAPPYTGGQSAPVINVQPRPLAEKIQAAVLVVLVIIIIATVLMISVRRPGSHISFWTGMALGALTGATAYWVISSSTKLQR